MVKNGQLIQNEKIDVHEKVKVLQINGVKLKVKKEGK